MSIGIIVGSHRQNSQSSKVGKFCKKLAAEKGVETEVFDLADNPLPLWSEEKWKQDSDLQEVWQPYRDRLNACDSFIVIAPEWAGMVPAGLKNFFLFCDGGELAHKPGMIVGVSASRGGAYPVAELRTSSYKNCFLCYVPDHVIVRDVEKVLNDSADSSSDADKYIRNRIDYSIDMLVEYSAAFKQVRASGKIDREKYPFGM